ncbi:hypothetical protein H261_08263 [Paramagnetospirillum caucaseum]|uniref:Uncharacterized protein n=1 Tax=Paramagnetospirillum caucaseum TaxID=1244869 RepID=M2YBS2_9PROT|nr:hypothetical protein [Paramagnetospirillum caucaseum]EME70461.1 hypothetical protein H261_08263 [Paramagnetospirillum caucaseum]
MPDERPGLAGLDNNMMDRIERGLLTKVEAARLLGVSKQAVSKGLQRRRAKAAGAVAPEPARTTPAPADRPPESQPQQVATASPAERSDHANETQAQAFDEAERWAEIGGQSWRGLAHAYAAVVVEARDQVVAGRGKIGPVAMNGLVRSLRESEEGLRRLGLLPAIAGGNQDNDKPANLVITVLSPAEEDEIRAEIAERAGESLDNTAADSPIEPAPPVAAPSAMIPGTLPTPENFRAWLETEAHFRGTKWLKQVVGALGGKISHSKADLIAELLRLTDSDPEKLQPLQVPA